MPTLAIIEDHPAIAEGIGLLLRSEPDIELVGMARDRAGADALRRERRPDVVLCDVALDTPTAGLELLRTHRRTGGPAFVMFSAYDYPSYLASAVDAGASGYLSKMAPVARILEAIRAAGKGQRSFEASVLRSARRAPRQPSRRELEVIGLVRRGYTNERIAERLGLSVKTVESHLRRLYTRYATTNRAELAMLAATQGWVSPSDDTADADELLRAPAD